MRVASLSESVRSMNRIHEKQDSDAHQRRHGQSHSDQRREEKAENFASDENVQAAISAFGADAQNRAAGITADRIGSGPGLKVVLRDGTGAVIRQLTGEEFLKVRDAVRDGRPRGKLLDQKL